MLKSQTAKGRCICLTTNLADLCRECEVRQSVKELEEENMSLRKAGQRLTVEWEDGLLLLKLKEEGAE